MLGMGPEAQAAQANDMSKATVIVQMMDLDILVYPLLAMDF